MIQLCYPTQGKVQARGMAISQKNPETGELINISESIVLAEHNCNPHVQIKLLKDTLAIFSRENSIDMWEIKMPVRYTESM